MGNVRVVTDSSCGLPDDVADRYGIAIVPFTIRFGDEEFLDRKELGSAEFWIRCARAPEPPTTAAPSPGAFEQAFRASSDAEAVVCVTISSSFSASFQSATTAAGLLGQDTVVRVVDSRSTSLGVGMVALRAARHAAEGGDIDEVVATAEDGANRLKLVATFDTLESLKRGGRIGEADALLDPVLTIKPVIEVVDGVVTPGPKQRTRSRAVRHLVDMVAEEADGSELGIFHGAAPDLDELVDLVAQYVPRHRVVIGEVGAAIGSHTGPGTLGVTYLRR